MSQYDKVFLRPDVDFDKVRDGRRSPLFFYDVDLTSARSIAAGTAEELPLAGDTFVADMNPDAQGDATVHFQDTNRSSQGAPVYVTRGAIWKVPFTKMLIENVAQPGKRLRFFYGVNLDAFPGASSSVNVAGNVSVIDGGKARTTSGIVALSSAQLVAVAAQYSKAGLWNPVGSGVRAVIRTIRAAASAPADVYVIRTAAAISGLSVPYSLKIDAAFAAPPVSTRSHGLTDANAPLTYGTAIGTLTVPASQTISHQLDEPIILRPGNGLILGPSIANVGITTFLSFWEEADS